MRTALRVLLAFAAIARNSTQRPMSMLALFATVSFARYRNDHIRAVPPASS